PLVHISQHLVGSLALALLLPESTQAQRRPQFEGLCLLAASDAEGVLITVFGLRTIRCRARQQQLALQAMQFRFPPPLLSCVRQGQCLFEDSQPFLLPSFLPICLGQLRQIPWSRQLRPRGTPGSHTLAYLLTPFHAPFLCG